MANKDRAAVKSGLSDILGNVIQSDRRRAGRGEEQPAASPNYDAMTDPSVISKADSKTIIHYDNKSATQNDSVTKDPAASTPRKRQSKQEAKDEHTLLQRRIEEAQALADSSTTTVTLRIPHAFNEWLDEYVHGSWPERIKKQQLVTEALQLLFARRGRPKKRFYRPSFCRITNDWKPSLSRSLIPNSTQIPDVILDHWMAELTGAEFKVLMYIARRTYGFGKDGDTISLAQITSGITRKDGVVLDRGTGLTKMGVCKVLDALEQRGLIKRRQRDSKKSGHLPTFYSLNLDAGLPAPLVNSVDKGGLQTEFTRDVSKSLQGLVNSVDIQETGKQETVGQETAAADAAVAVRPKSRRVAKGAAAASDGEKEEVSDPETLALIAALVLADLNRTDAERFAKTKPDEARRQLEYLPFKTDLENPGGYLRSAIEGGFPPPKEYKAAKAKEERERRKREEAERRRATEAAQKAQEAAEAARIDEYIGRLEIEAPDTYGAFARYVETKKAQVKAKFQSLAPTIRNRMLADLDTPAKRREIFAEWQALPRKEPDARGEWQQLSIPDTAMNGGQNKNGSHSEDADEDTNPATIAELVSASLRAAKQ